MQFVYFNRTDNDCKRKEIDIIKFVDKKLKKYASKNLVFVRYQCHFKSYKTESLFAFSLILFYGLIEYFNNQLK